MKVFLVFYVLLSGDPEPIEQAKEVASAKECWAQMGKLMAQPLPKNVDSIQYSCVVKFGEGA